MRSIIARSWMARLLSGLLLVAVLVPALPVRQVARAATPVPEEFFKAPEVKEFLSGFSTLSQDELRQVSAMEDPEHPARLPVWVQVQTLLATEAEYEEWKWALDPNQNGGTRTLGEAVKQINVILKGYEKVLGLVPEMLFPPAAVAEASDLVVGSFWWYVKWLKEMRSWQKDAEKAAGILGLFKGSAINRNLNEIIWYSRDSDPEESDDQRQVVEMLAEGAGMSPELAVAFGHRVHEVLNSDPPGERRALMDHIYELARAQGFSLSDPTVRAEGDAFLFSAAVTAPATTYPVRLHVEARRGVSRETYSGEPVPQGQRPTVTVKGLRPGEYTWRVRASGSYAAATAWIAPGGYAEGRFVVRAAGQKGPAAPTLLSATPRSDGARPGILLQWRPVEGALYYSVYRDGALIFTTKTASTTFWNISGLKPGSRYEYQVRAHTADSVSDYSPSLSAVAPPPGEAAGAARILVDGSLIPLDVAPVNVDGRLLVPLRAIAEALGAGVAWDAGSRTATLSLAGTVVKVTVDAPEAMVNDKAVALAAPARNIDGRVMVPLRFVGESFGASVGWNAKTSTVAVLGKGPDANLDSKPASAFRARLAAGRSHSLFVKSDGTVWVWGYELHGQLGDGPDNGYYRVPIQVSGLKEMVAVASHYDYSLTIKSDGTVWAWGENEYGELLDGTTKDLDVPMQVPGLAGVVAVAAGDGHFLALKSDGTVWGWGSNGLGQLGDGTTINRRTDGTTIGLHTPVQVTGLTGVVAVAAGGVHSLAVKADGTVWEWGDNFHGHICAWRQDCQLTPIQVSGLMGVVAVASAQDYSLAVKSDGTVWTWRKKGYGELGGGPTGNPVQVSGLAGIVAVAAGAEYSLALKSDGTVWAWGHNPDGQLGDGTTDDRHTPVQVTGLTGVVAVAADFYHSLALKSDGTVWAWGNAGGFLGNGAYENSLTPVRVLLPDSQP